ncbi:MAG: hypothetical protein HWD58_09070 [Bacteroidota bacterium]|nr:MAG: hypothetical protein HWD58_09070 [Bacteroidota bacterium]
MFRSAVLWSLLMGCLLVSFFCSGIGKSFQRAWFKPIQWMGYQADAVPGEGFLMYSNRVIRFEPRIQDFMRSDTSQGRYLYIEAADSAWRIYPVYSLQEGVRLCPRRDWVIYTEGMGKTFQGNIERAAAMQQTYQVNVLLFDYASIASDLGMFKNFRLAMQNAASSHRQFDRLLDSVRQLRMASMWADQNITLFFIVWEIWFYNICFRTPPGSRKTANLLFSRLF